MSRLAYIAAGLVAGVVLASTGTALSAWLVTGHGEVGAKMARLSDLDVTVQKVDGAWPGDTVVLHATVKSGNARTLKVTGVTLTGLTSDVPGCATGVRFVEADGLVVAPGDNQLDVGKLTFPDGLATKCAGATISGDLAVETSFGT